MGYEATLKLEVAPPWGDTFERVVLGDHLVIGRSSRADLTLTDNAVSREHAKLSRLEGVWRVEDMGSRNGTYVNGKLCEGPTALRFGDVLSIGGTSLTVRPGSAGPRPSVPRPTAGGQSVFLPVAEILAQGGGEGPAPPPDDRDALAGYAERLRILNEVHRALGRSLSLEDLLDMILDRAFDHLRPEEGAIYLKGPDGDLSCAASRTAKGHEAAPVFSRHLVREVAEKGLGALVLDTREDERFSAAASIMDAGVRSLVAAPLGDAEGNLGMIVLSSTLTVRQFTEEDLELLASLGAVAALRIRNVALAAEAVERRRLEDEVALARRIQVALLPSELPSVPGWDLYGRNLPSRWVSGDFYQLLTRREGTEMLAMVVDVSGKGIAASLLTASLEALAASPIEAGRDPFQVFERVNALLHRRTPPGKFATAFLAVVDAATGAVRFANAGHPPGLLVRAGGRVEWLEATGLPLGLWEDSRYDQKETRLEPGDTLILYSDGVNEAMNAEGEEYDFARLEALCVEHRGDDLRALASTIEEDMERFAQGTPFGDDRTTVFVRRLATA